MNSIQNKTSSIDIVSGKIVSGTETALTLYKSNNVKTFQSDGVKFTSSVTNWTDVMTLPDDCKPQVPVYTTMYNGTAGNAVIYIGANGNVQTTGASANTVYLFCISYL